MQHRQTNHRAVKSFSILKCQSVRGHQAVRLIAGFMLLAGVVASSSPVALARATTGTSAHGFRSDRNHTDAAKWCYPANDVFNTFTTYHFTGHIQQATIPARVGCITITAYGAQGGGGNGGLGGSESAFFPVKPGEKLSVVAGGTGGDGFITSGYGGYGGGGAGGQSSGIGGPGGGGGSFVYGPSGALLIAAGGGGGYKSCEVVSPAPGQTCLPIGGPGSGGGLSGVAGVKGANASGSGPPGGGGGGAGSSSPGTGGTAGGGTGGIAGKPGSGSATGVGNYGMGGVAGGGNASGQPGGGGGGGYFGGGGAGGGGAVPGSQPGSMLFGNGGQGGGGSGDVSGTGADVTSSTGVNSGGGGGGPGDGYVTITTWLPTFGVTDVSPDSGSVAWRTPLVISGQGLKGETDIKFVAASGDTLAGLDASCPTETKCMVTTPSPEAEKLITKSLQPVTTDVVVSGPNGTTQKQGADQFTFDPTSVVQLGDSVASGEGTLYDFYYDTNSRKWKGGIKNPAWPGPFPLCHDSPDAYGSQVADDLSGSLLQLGCTGASFFNGIALPNFDPDTHQQRGPAEFGNWANQRDLNAGYDKAKPDVVLVTMGADDIHFASIVADCVASHITALHVTCVPGNPGKVVEDDFFKNIGAIATHLRQLVQWIQARGDKLNPTHPPKIVFTDYYDPFPPAGERCPDTWNLSLEQLKYLGGLMTQLDSTIRDAIQPLTGKNVAFVELDHAFVGHTWCSPDPWAYGLSIDNYLSHDNPAPFHPTPVGQLKIAKLVEPAVDSLLPGTGK